MAEGAPLLREYGGNFIEGSNPSLSAKKYAPVAQLDRVPGYEPGGREFESLRARQNSCKFKEYFCAPVAQLDRVPGFEPGGREFESLRARHFFSINKVQELFYL